MSHDCCAPDRGRTPIGSGEERTCRECGRRGRPVAPVTPESLLKPEAAARLEAGAYYFDPHPDPHPDCQAVYFSNKLALYFHKEGLAVRVGLKEEADPIPVCYCFGHTRESIEGEILRAGRSAVFDEVARKVQAGECECEIRNPSVRCCLGEIFRTVRSFQLRMKPNKPQGVARKAH